MAIRILVSLGLAVSTLSLVACSMTDDVKEAKDTSKDMNKKMTGMMDATDNMKDRTSNLFAGARKDLSFTRTTERYEDIIEHESPSLKILFASAYMRSQAWQQWTGTYQDTPELKKDQIADSVRDFLWRMENLVDHEIDPDTRTYRILPYWSKKDGLHRVAIPLMPGNKWKSAASIAVALGEVDPDQVKASKVSGVPYESMYTLIVKGLQYKKKSFYVGRENIPTFAQNILGREREAVYLLQLRHNYFLAMIMSRFTDFATAPGFMHGTDFTTSLGRNLNQFWSWFKVNRFGFDMDVRNVDNLAKVQEEAVMWMQMAQETQGVLEYLGYKLRFNGGIQQLWAGFRMRVPADWPLGLVEVDKTFKEVDKLTSELQWTYRTKQSGDSTYIPDYLMEKAAMLTPAELKQGLLPEPKQDLSLNKIAPPLSQ